VVSWADANKIVIKWAKTKEVVFRHPVLTIAPLNDIEQVTSARLLGIIFHDKLSFDEHVTSTLTACNHHSYIMKLLRDQVLPHSLLDNVFQSLIISKI